MKITTPKLFLFTFGVAALLPLLAPAASITLTNSDGLGGSSFNAKGFWNSSTAPMAGNDYIGGNFLLRTPPNASSHTFGGDSLTINNNNGTAGGLAYKGTGTNGILTITNLILDGGLVFQLNGAGDLFQLAGGITVLSSGTVDTRQGLIVVHSALAGSGNLTNTTSQNADRAIVYTGNNSSFLGRMVMANANSRLQITNEINLGGNPAVFTPDALLIQAGWLQSGLTNNVLLNDANRGITLNGTWSVNPQAASSITIVCPIVGAGEIWKRGPGVLALAGDNSGHFGGVRLGAFSAGSQVNVNSTTALGTGPLIIPNDGNQPTLDNGSGSALTTAGNNNQNWNRSFTFLGSSSLNLGSGLVTLGNNVAVTVSNNTLTVGAVVEDGLIRSLTKQGPGTLVINGGASHLGNTVVNEGVLTLLTAGIASSPTITVASNATLNVSGLGVTLAFGQTLAGSGIIIGNVADGGSSTLINPGPGAGTLSITGNLALNGGGAVNFDLTGVTTVGSGVNDLIAVSGELNFAGATTINILGAPATGIYTLFQYGSFAGSLANVTVPPGFTLTNNTTAKTIELIAAHIPANLTWRGDGAVNTWDVGVTANWIQSGTNQFFFNTDTVTFDNTGSNTPAIALASELSPAAVIVNASQDYTFSGSGIASGSLTKNGAGTLVLDNTNTYSGPTVINAGTLQLGDSTGAAGGTTFGVAGNIGTGPVTNHGNLLFSRASDLTIATAIAGSGSISNVGSAGTVTLSGNVSGTTVTMSGSGALALTASNSYAGLTRITSGTLLARHTNALGTAIVGTIVEGGGTLYFDLNQPMSIADEVISLDNGTLRRGAGQVLTLGLPLALGAGGGTLSVDGGATLDLTNTAGITGTDVGLILTGGNNGNGTVSGPINLGTGALTVSGGFWNVAPNNNYTGKTFLNGGRLLIPDLTALGPNPGVATPDFVTFNGGLLAVTNSQTFSGGTRGLTSSGGGTLFVQDAAATLTVSGDLNGSGNFTKWGPGTLILSGVNSFAGSFYVDSTGFGNDGITRIASPNALANVPVIPGTPTLFQGNNNAGWSTLQLDGSGGAITLPQDWSINCRGNDNPNVQNLSGNNTLSGTIHLNVGGNRVIFQSDAGLLTLSGSQQYVGTLTGGRAYTFTGAGNILVSGVINDSVNGAPISVVKNGPGKTTLSAANTYQSTTTINAGILELTGSLTSTGGVSVVGGALAGNGTITDNVIVQSSIPSGTLDALTVNGNYTINGTLAVDVNRAGFGSDLTTVSASLSAVAGAVSVNKLGATLQVGDTFTLFNQPVTGGGALSVTGGGATWNNNLAVNGTIQVATLVPTTPTTLTATPSGNTLSLSWPATHLGWVLQVQTNSLNVGIATNWVDVPATATITATNLAINPANPTAFFRLRAP